MEAKVASRSPARCRRIHGQTTDYEQVSRVSIEIVGHTCSIGAEKANYNVGLQRAINAKKYLVDKGIDANRISIVSKGYNCPKASNDTPEGRAMNRRITFNVIK